LSAPALNPRFEKIFLLQPVLFSPIVKLFIPGALKANVEELYHLKQDLKTLAKDLSRVTAPVTILHGDQDGLVPVSNAQYGKDKLVNARSVRIEIISGAGHSIPDTQFALFKSVLLSLTENKD
jgi:pimeloyl-ACP methyl ester carboxylesterase